ncbi:amidase domain-containing protein [Virgibacillus doumboii]|uniref:amidase domain-containing protein n=1 Tax=Virgibacillus doumboii TaxID=2697503 RepID=UPI0013DF2DEF|nr:amidase domain-containing protein [Virgibacillus doumboii]
MEKLKEFWEDFFQSERKESDWWERKKALCRDREAEIARISGEGQFFEKVRCSNKTSYQYLLHLSFLMKQHDQFIREEQVVPFQFSIENGQITDHKAVEIPKLEDTPPSLEMRSLRNQAEDERFSYDRRAAVQYAERWWNSYNPAYRKFDVDCTNYVSQCLRAGGAPMRGAPDRGNGWWYQSDNWSYSWAVAHSLRWYLSGSTAGLTGKEVDSASDLIPGDVICYDFQGTGRFDHNTFVVAKDAYGMPLVNAHTDNSRNRYWSYEDSTAWTPDIQYKFFRIGE